MATENSVDEQQRPLNGYGDPNAQYMAITVDPGSRATFKSSGKPIPLLIINLEPFCKTDAELNDLLNRPFTIDLTPPTDTDNQISNRGKCIVNIGGKKRPNESSDDNPNKNKKIAGEPAFVDYIIKEEIKEESDDNPDTDNHIPDNTDVVHVSSIAGIPEKSVNIESLRNSVSQVLNSANKTTKRLLNGPPLQNKPPVVLSTTSFYFAKIRNSSNRTKYKCMQCDVLIDSTHLRQHVLLCPSQRNK